MPMRINLQGRTSPVTGALISSIQTGTIGIVPAALSNTTTITSVDMSKTILLHNGTAFVSGTGASYSSYLTRLTLTNDTTVTATRHDNQGDSTSRFTVLEFSGGIASIQRGIITMVNVKNKTATISSVDTSKAFVNYLGHTEQNVVSRENVPYIWLVNSTTVQAYCDNVNRTTVISYEVIEFE